MTTNPRTIRFPAVATVHDNSGRLYFRIPKAAWDSYNISELLEKPVLVKVWKHGEDVILAEWNETLSAYGGTGRFVTGIQHKLEVGSYIMSIQSVENK